MRGSMSMCVEALEGRVLLAAGSLVSSYGTGGYALPTSMESRDEMPVAVAVESDGDVLVLGAIANSMGSIGEIVRYLPSGQLDPSFGASGVMNVMSSFTGAIARNDGKILLTGSILGRLNSNGAVDTAFGAVGQFPLTGQVRMPSAVVMQPDGRILAAGPASSTMVIERYTSVVGMLDWDFGTSGRVVENIAGTPRKIVLENDGDILVAGSVSDSGKDKFLLMRYKPDGTRDASFGVGGTGRIITEFPSPAAATDLLVQGDSIMLAGIANGPTDITPKHLVMARYTLDGQLDTTFADGGTLLNPTQYTGIGDSFAAQFLSDGSVLFAGVQSGLRPLLAHYDSVGQLDAAFGSGGVLTGSMYWGKGRPVVTALSDGKFIIAGDDRFPSTGTDFVVARYLSNGTLDPTFGQDGKVTTDIKGPTPHIIAGSSMALGDRTVMLMNDAGLARTGACLQRYTANGFADYFAVGDRTAALDLSAHQIASDKGGRVLVVGETTNALKVYCYRPTGMLDASFGAGGQVSVARMTQASSDPCGDSGSWVVPGGINAVQVQQNGSILVGAWQGKQVEVWRLTSAGRFDRRFGAKGKAIFATAGNLRITQLIQQRDGKILLLQESPGKVSIRRLNANGRLDTSFGNNGRFLARDRGSNWRMALRRDGSMILSGLGVAGSANGHAIVLCVDSEGQLDSSFGKGGRITYAAKGSEFAPRGLAVQSDGKIILSGWANRAKTSISRLDVLRFDATGRLDKTFGRAGLSTTSTTAFGWNHAADVYVRKDGNILIAAADDSRTYLVLLSGK